MPKEPETIIKMTSRPDGTFLAEFLNGRSYVISSYRPNGVSQMMIVASKSRIPRMVNVSKEFYRTLERED